MADDLVVIKIAWVVHFQILIFPKLGAGTFGLFLALADLINQVFVGVKVYVSAIVGVDVAGGMGVSVMVGSCVGVSEGVLVDGRAKVMVAVNVCVMVGVAEAGITVGVIVGEAFSSGVWFAVSVGVGVMSVRRKLAVHISAKPIQ